MPKKPTREVLYPEKEARVLEEDQALTSEQAQELLGWTSPEEGVFEDYHFKDKLGKTIFCHNVELQRPYYMSQVENLKWEILQGNWQMNMESIIIGQTGLILEGKHRLTALVFAVEEWYRNPERYPFWSEEPTIEVLLAYGAIEDKRVVNTMGTGKPRSLADSLYASGIFEGFSKKEMRELTRILDYTIRTLWERTGARDDAYNPRASHSDALNFLDRHQGIIESVRHIYGEDSGPDKRLSSLIGSGYLAGLCYLASASATDPKAYREAEEPSEEYLDFSNADKAEEFLVLLSGRDKTFTALIKEVASYNEMGNVSTADRIALFAKSYAVFLSGDKMVPSAIRIEHHIAPDGKRTLVEDPVVGGIDLGFHKEL